MKVQLYGRTYYAKKNATNSISLYKTTLHYILDIPSVSLTMMYEMYNEMHNNRIQNNI